MKNNTVMLASSYIAGEDMRLVFDSAAPGKVVIIVSKDGIHMGAPLSELICLVRKAKREFPELMREIDIQPANHS